MGICLLLETFLNLSTLNISGNKLKELPEDVAFIGRFCIHSLFFTFSFASSQIFVKLERLQTTYFFCQEFFLCQAPRVLYKNIFFREHKICLPTSNSIKSEFGGCYRYLLPILEPQSLPAARNSRWSWWSCSRFV